MAESSKKEGQIGITYPMLTKTNYTVWAMKIRVFMQAHGVWEAVEPKDPKAVVEDKVDKRALAMIYQSIPEDLLLTLAERKTAKEAWDAIKTVSLGADKVKKAKAQTLKSEFESLNMKDSEQLDDFCMKLNGLVARIRALGETIGEEYVVKKLLRAVPTKFLQIASAIEQFGNLETMSVEEVIGSLKAHEERLSGQSDSKEGQQLLLTEEEWSKRENSGGKLLLTREEWLKRSNKEGQVGSDYRERNNQGGRGRFDRSKIKCFNCGAYGHFQSECRKPKKDRMQRGEANLTQTYDEEPALLVAMNEEGAEDVILLSEGADSNLNMKEENIWYLDNGASNHMTGCREKFESLDKTKKGQVKFGDGSLVKIEGKGSIRIKCKNGETRILQGVYYIPTLRSNIISLGQLSEEGNRVVLNGGSLWIYDSCGRLLMHVRRSSNRLYKIHIEDTKEACLLTKEEEKTWLWHLRLGHVNFKAMKLMSKNQMAYGFPSIDQPRELCSGCLMAKQSRKPFPTQSKFTSEHVLQLVHGDLCGPISPPTPAGNQYFMLLVDDYSRMMWVYMLKSKNEALNCFKKFKLLVENASKKRIQVFRTDRGGEFCSNAFESCCEQAGILRHYTAPYTPQQNGVVERRNRTVMAMTRSLLKERGVPAKFWGEAVRHSVYLLNKLPTRALSDITPYQAWFGQKPSVESLKVFGCLAYMKVPSPLTRKLDDRSSLLVHFGREPGTKAYRLYDPILGRIHVSRDVTFIEDKGWTWDKIADTNTSSGGEQIQFESEVITSDAQESDEPSSVEPTSDSSQPTSPVSQMTPVTPVSVPSSPTTAEFSSSSASTTESAPKRYRRLSDIYNATEEVEFEDELLLSGVDEPVTFEQAIKDEAWREAMNTEITAIEQNKTWQLTDLPKDHKAIDLKWVFKLKRGINGNDIKHKARLVAKGYVQKHGIDYNEVFAPVARLETVRLLLALAAKNEWEVHHLDVKSAFLNGVLLEEVYVSQPKGYVKEGQEQKVYKLFKALYGLRQAPRAWYSQLNKCLLRLGFTKCPYEHAVYIRKEGSETLLVGVYVDDLIITGSNLSHIVKFKGEMSSEFDMTDLGKLSYYLGLEVEQGRGYIEIKQTTYAKKVLQRAGMSECRAVKYPMEANLQIDSDINGMPVDSTLYKSLVGGLRYLVYTRPDIAYAVGIVSRFMEKPTSLHLNAIKRICRYIKGTLHYGLTYTKGRGNYILSGFSDSDLAGSLEDRKSTSGMAFYLDESLISWVSQKQRCVALSSCEAEFMAATTAACQGIWLQRVLSQITETDSGPIVLYIDNRSAIDLAKNPVFHGRSKHIDVRYHFIRECVEQGLIVIKHIKTGEQRADILTKALTTVKFERMRRLLGVKNLEHV